MRQAVGAGRRRGPVDVLLGVAALVVLVALVAGVPYALYSRFGSPVPDHLPDLDAFTQRIGPSSVISILVFLVWLAWLQLVACVVVEVYAGLRGIGVPTRVPLAGGTQSLVHRLVVTALLLFTATTAIMPAFSARGGPPARPAYAQSQQYAPPAAQNLEPFDAGTPAADRAAGHAVEHTADHRAETPEVAKIYRVHPPAGRHHESLWEIAEKCLGDGRRYREIYDLNKGHQQPDGSRLTIASLIRPGWILRMPADAVGAHVVPAHELDDYYRFGKPHHIPDHGTGGTTAHPGNGQAAPGHAAPGHATAAPEQPRPAESRQSEQQRPEQHPGDQHAGDQHPGNQGHHDHGGIDIGWPQALSVASLLAAGLLVALGRRRREQMWHRSFGEMIARPEGAAAQAEQALRIGADTEATRLLDLGLRQLSKALAADDRSLPTVYGVHLGRESLDLWIGPADRSAPEPWEAHDNGQVWRLRADRFQAGAGDGVFDVEALRDVLAPYPGLISIGTNDTGRILVDLEAAHGLIALRGPDDVRRAVLAAVAVELATNRWSDHMRITLVGFDEELSLIAPDRIRVVGSLAEALPELEARSEEVRQALAASGADSVLTGRCRGVFGEAWMPHYLIMADPPSEQEAERLVALARTGQRMAAGYVVAGDVAGATWTWDVTADGRLSAGVLGFDVEAQLVPEQHYRAVVELFRTARRVDGVPLPTPRTDDEPPSPLGDQHAVVDIRLLGPIEIDAPGPLEESRRAACTEVLIHLAAHPGGVHPTVLSGAVWPRGASAGVRDATIARVSDWLGRDSRGRPNLYYDDRGRIKLGSEVRVDWQVFRWLVWRSGAEPASETAYMSYALDLIRGPLLADRPRGRYGWLADDPLEYESAAQVADVAHRLVLLRLDEGDPKAAVTAARAGLRFNPSDEAMWRDLLRATHATGDLTQLRAVVDELRDGIERDPAADQMQPETEALIEELMPYWRQVALPGG
ncbi:MAG TPA: hypothetical protein VF069_08240 [Streptosporangiaceae bacterium]